jgi:hypothetical protein
MWRVAMVTALSSLLPAGVVIDRIEAVVNRHAIKASDVDRDLRVTAFLNGEPLHFDAPAHKKALERLIDQEAIRAEVASGGYERASDADADALAAQIRRDRFGASIVRMNEALTRYGLTDGQLHAQLLWQLTVLRFIDQRFGSGTDADKAFNDWLQDARQRDGVRYVQETKP